VHNSLHINVKTNEIAEKGEKIYQELLKEQWYKSELMGKFAAIDTETREFFIADRAVEALDKAKKKYPTKIFYLVRIGYKTAHFRR